VDRAAAGAGFACWFAIGPSVQLRSGLEAQVHAVMGNEGVLPALTDMFCQAGQRELDRMELDDVYVVCVESLRDLIANRESLVRTSRPATRADTHCAVLDVEAYAQDIGPKCLLAAAHTEVLVPEKRGEGAPRGTPPSCRWPKLRPAHLAVNGPPPSVSLASTPRRRRKERGRGRRDHLRRSGLANETTAGQHQRRRVARR
jgi:hypothetical protein